MDQRISDLKKRGERLLEKRGSLLSHWQDIAQNFYPERADFTSTRTMGQEFATDLSTSYPILARRDLGSAFSAMLRPTGKPWFRTTVEHEEGLDIDGRRWLEEAEGIQRRAMYDALSGFVRGTKEGDHDFAAFGQCVLSIDLNRRADGLTYRCWHLRDCAWAEDEEGHIGFFVRKWAPDAGVLVKYFPNTASTAAKQTAKRDPFATVDCRQIVVLTEDYDADAKLKRYKFCNVTFETETGQVLEEVGAHTNRYIVPRWQTVSGSQYAYSPATVAALADARLLQSMTAVLLEAGEKAVDQPMVAKGEIIRSDIDIRSGGVTWVDPEYDERLGEALRPLYGANHASGLPMGLEMAQDVRSMLSQAFFLNKLSLPPPADGREMTAYEAGQRVTEYIRQALPLFEPMEHDYNGALCERTFDVLFRVGGFGPMQDIPRSLAGADVKFKFQTPLQAAMDANKAALFQQSQALLAAAVQIDPKVANVIDIKTAFQDAIIGVGAPARWIRSDKELAKLDADQKAMEDAAKLAAGAQAAGAVAKDFSAANKNLVTAPQQAVQ